VVAEAISGTSAVRISERASSLAASIPLATVAFATATAAIDRYDSS
jgi:hypothetical protein